MESRFVEAAGHGDRQGVQLLIDQGVDINDRNSSGKTGLATAAGFGHAAICDELLKRGAHIDCRDRAGATPLHGASGYGHKGVVRLLIQKGADVNAQDKFGDTPAHRAAAHNHSSVLKELHQSSADFRRKNKKGHTPLEIAQQENNMNAFKFLSAILTGEGSEKRLPLHSKAEARPMEADSNGDEQQLLVKDILQKVELLAEEKQKNAMQLQEQLDQKQVLVTQLEQQIQRINREKKEQERQRGIEISRLKRENDAVKVTLTRQAEQRQRELEKMTKETTILREKNKQLEKDNQDDRKRIDSLERALKNAESATEEAEAQLGEYEKVFTIPAEVVRVTPVLLGHGSYGEVRVAYWRGCPVAVKMFYKELTKERHQKKLLQQEVSVSSKLNHPNIIKVCGVTSHKEHQFCLVMELLQGSLSEVIEAAQASDNYLTIREQVDVARDCLHGLNYLHQMQPTGALHGDIRPTNVLLTPTMRAKLCDLGTTRFDDADLSVGPVSPEYVASERLADRSLPNSCEADVYSMGVTLCELFTGQSASRTARQRQLRLVSQFDLRDMCLRMTSEDRANRIPACEALAIIDSIVGTEEYTSCLPRRMVRGIMDGVQSCTLTDKPW